MIKVPFLWGLMPFLLKAAKKVSPGMTGPYSDLHPTLQESSDEEDEAGC